VLEILKQLQHYLEPYHRYSISIQRLSFAPKHFPFLIIFAVDDFVIGVFNLITGSLC